MLYYLVMTTQQRHNHKLGVKCSHKEITGKKVEVVWACDEKRGTLRRKEGDDDESTGEKEERKT